MALPAPYRPLPVVPGLSNYARKVWWSRFELIPGVTLKTTVRLRPSLAARAEEPRHLLPALLQAASAALSLHPRLNFYTFWGRLYWAGEPVRVGVVVENPDQTCGMAILSDAHRLSWPELDLAMRKAHHAPPPTILDRLREAWPVPTYVLERISGFHARSYMRHKAPLFISMLALPGIGAPSFVPAHSMALLPGWPQGGLLPLALCFNHQLANARPVGRLLLTIKDLLE
ncbi:MAG: hypothetical protein HY910_16360 [Desulfarculus sp.]|nr:hypothetical protein [Desulfarculus sp.]